MDPAFCSLEYRLKIIGRLPFFKHLRADAISNINVLFHDRDVQAQEQTYFEGDWADFLDLVAMRKVKLVRNLASGREVFLDILHGGDYFSTPMMYGGYLHRETAIAQTDGCILQISSSDFDSILTGYPEVMRRALEVVSQRLADSQEVIKQLSAYTSEQRIAVALLLLAEKLGEIRG